MVEVQNLGWDGNTVGELDHRLLKAPRVKLRNVVEGNKGDVVYCVDLRMTQPNTDFLPIPAMHSLEHLLLAGFQKHMPAEFISLGLMGCQTGFYLVLFNEGRAQEICGVYESILKEILRAVAVPYANVEQCGNYRNHDLAGAQAIAKRILDARADWMQVV